VHPPATSPPPLPPRAASLLCRKIDELHRVERDPAVLLIDADAHESWGHAELGQAITGLARALVTRGVRRAEPIAIIGAERPPWIIAALAAIRSGAAAMPVDAQLPDATLAHVLADSETRFAFVSSRHSERIRLLSPHTTQLLIDVEADDARGWRQLLGDADADLPALDDRDRAALFYTSGTTGPPKGVPLDHGNLAFQIDAIAATNILEGIERVALAIPLHHVYPFVLGLLTPLLLGHTVVLPGALTGPRILDAVVRGEATAMVGVPRVYESLVAGVHARVKESGAPAARTFAALLSLCIALHRHLGLHAGRTLFRRLRNRVAPRLRLLACGGAALDPAIARTLVGLGWDLAIGYGLTETSPLLTANLPGGRRLSTAGRPLRGVQIRIDAPAGRPGEILARGAGVFAGYLNLPEKTRAALDAEGWFHTGDEGWIDRHGELVVIGRASDVIVTSSGENVQPEAVESAYEAHPFIREFALLESGGQLVGLVVPDVAAIRRADRPDLAGATRDAVQEIGRRLPSYQRVTDCALTREALPRTRLGKLRRHLLAAHLERARASAPNAVVGAGQPMRIADMQESDRALFEAEPARVVWDWACRRFPGRALTPDTQFRLDLGVDSLGWLDLAVEIQHQTTVELTETSLANIESIRDLLREVAQARREGVARAAEWDQPERVLDAAQQRWLAPRTTFAKLIAAPLFALLALVLRLAFRLRVVGLDRLPRVPLVFAPNHLSALDPFLLAVALGFRRLDRVYWAGWTGIAFATPLRRALSRLACVLPIDPERNPVTSLAFGAAVLARGDGLVWFPEGARSLDGSLKPFRPGIGRLLHRFPATVVPVSIAGSFEALPPKRRLPRFVPVTVTFGEPVPSRQLVSAPADAESLARALHDRVAALQVTAGTQ
jgi:long-chain acyl-CoA synthetase